MQPTLAYMHYAQTLEYIITLKIVILKIVCNLDFDRYQGFRCLFMNAHADSQY